MDSLLYPNNDEVLIIVEGNVIIYDHGQNFTQPKIVATYRSGDIIGAFELENYISQKPDFWFITQTRVEYIIIKKVFFE